LRTRKHRFKSANNNHGRRLWTAACCEQAAVGRSVTATNFSDELRKLWSKVRQAVSLSGFVSQCDPRPPTG